MNKFRELRADEIDCRVASIKENGLSLLLYKDARCDQNILDETVGPMNWQRKHTRENRNCIVSIWDQDKGQWIEKEDTGTESNTEREKGLASDSFKRACFNWGIGRELYTAPFIWIHAKDCQIKKDQRGKLACYDRFTVKGIGYTDGVITGLQIKNQASEKMVYSWGEVSDEAPERPEAPEEDQPNIQMDAPATVEKTDAVPGIEVSDYIHAEVEEIQKLMKLETYDEAQKLVTAWVKALVKSDVISPVNWYAISVDEAVNVFKAIHETFRPGEKK